MKSKAPGDFVTEVDLHIEDMLRRFFAEHFPKHGFLGEESTPTATDAEYCWVVDPIDGTSNYGRGLQVYAVAVACLRAGDPVAAAIHCQPDGMIYSAAKNLGTFANRRRLKLGDGSLETGCVVAGQWFRGDGSSVRFLQPLLHNGARVLNLGSTVVQLCQVASGRFQGNVQQSGLLWDIAAGSLLITEAGGKFTDWSGKDVFPVRELNKTSHHPSLAAGRVAHRQLYRWLRGYSPR